MSQKLVMLVSEGDAGVKTGSIFKIEIQLLDIREAHKKHINAVHLHCLISKKLVMPKPEGDLGVKPE